MLGQLSLGLLVTSSFVLGDNHDHSHASHTSHDTTINQVDSDDSGYDTSGYYNNYYNDPAYQQYYYGQDGAYANYPVGEQELVAKQQDEGSFIDRFFLGGGGGIPLPLAITLFLVDLVITAGFLLFPGTYTVAADSRRKRSIPDSKLDIIPGLCEEEDGSSSRLCRIMTTILSTVDCLDVARCEVAQLSESQEYPVMASMIQHFVPHNIRHRFRNVSCSTVKCSLKSSELPQGGGREENVV